MPANLQEILAIEVALVSTLREVMLLGPHESETFRLLGFSLLLVVLGGLLAMERWTRRRRNDIPTYKLASRFIGQSVPSGGESDTLAWPRAPRSASRLFPGFLGAFTAADYPSGDLAHGLPHTLFQ